MENNEKSQQFMMSAYASKPKSMKRNISQFQDTYNYSDGNSQSYNQNQKTKRQNSFQWCHHWNQSKKIHLTNKCLLMKKRKKIRTITITMKNEEEINEKNILKKNIKVRREFFCNNFPTLVITPVNGRMLPL